MPFGRISSPSGPTLQWNDVLGFRVFQGLGFRGLGFRVFETLLNIGLWCSGIVL